MLFNFFKSVAKLHLITERDPFSDHKKTIVGHEKYEYQQITIYQYITILFSSIKCGFFLQHFMIFVQSLFNNVDNKYVLDTFSVINGLKRTNQRLILIIHSPLHELPPLKCTVPNKQKDIGTNKPIGLYP